MIVPRKPPNSFVGMNRFNPLIKQQINNKINTGRLSKQLNTDWNFSQP